MNKTKALLFLVKCFFFIGWRIICSRDWNMFTVSLQNADDERLMIRYMRHCDSTDLMCWINHKDGSTEVIS